MSKAHQRLSQRLLMRPATAVALAGGLLAVGLGVGIFNDHADRVQTARAAQVQAEILAASVAGALAFDDPAAAQEYIDALKANRAIEAAAAYDGNGKLLARLQQAGGPPPAHPLLGGPTFEGQKLWVGAPVRQGTTELGAVYLRFTTEGLFERLSRYAGVAWIIIMAAILIAVLGASHARLAEAHRRLRTETEERERAQEALRQSQKMEAMGQLTGGVAHDFNNLLMVASSGLDLMDRTTDPARRARLRDGIRQAIDRGASLTQQLLAFARRAPVRPEVIYPHAALNDMMKLLDRSLREDVSVRLQAPSDLWPIEVDPSAFEVAVLNMAINARDAMPQGGLITIHAENAPAGDTTGAGGDMVRICVIDTGVGLPPDLAARVFEPFFTTKGVGQGTGLGLSQVYGFARSSGGDVEFISALGEGSTVCVRIPRSTKTPPAPTQQTDQTMDVPEQPARILLVEDDDGVAALVTEMLIELGYQLTRVRDGASALAVLDAGDAFDLLFSDMVMPGEIDGLQLAETASASHPSLPILLTTGYSAAAASAAAKGIRLLVKPYRIDALARELSAALRQTPVRASR